MYSISRNDSSRCLIIGHFFHEIGRQADEHRTRNRTFIQWSEITTWLMIHKGFSMKITSNAISGRRFLLVQSDSRANFTHRRGEALHGIGWLAFFMMMRRFLRIENERSTFALTTNLCSRRRGVNLCGDHDSDFEKALKGVLTLMAIFFLYFPSLWPPRWSHWSVLRKFGYEGSVGYGLISTSAFTREQRKPQKPFLIQPAPGISREIHENRTFFEEHWKLD